MKEGENPNTPVSSDNNFDADNSSSNSHIFGRNRRTEKRDYKEAPQFFKDAIAQNNATAVVEQQKSATNKKTIIKILIIALIVLVVVVVIVLLLRGNGIFSGNLTSKYNRYANYVFNGDDSAKTITEEYDPKKNYFFNKAGESEEKRTDIFTKTQKLADPFYAAAEKEADINPELAGEINASKDAYYFIMSVYAKNRPLSSDVIKTYINEGWDVAKKQLDEYYDYSNIDKSALLSNYKESFEKWGGSILVMTDIGERFDCINKDAGMIAHGCVKRKANKELIEKFNDYYESYREASLEINSYQNIGDEYIYHLFKINTYLGGSNG